MIKRVLIFLFLATSVYYSISLLRFLNKPVQHVLVESDLTTDESAVIKSLISDFQGRILDLGLLGQFQSELEKLSWVHRVGLSRDWPDTLILKVEKIAPLAKWNNDMYLTSQGRVIDSTIAYEGLPRFRVSISSGLKSMEVFRDLNEQFSVQNLEIKELIENRQGDWSVKFSNGLEIKLGRDRLENSIRKSILLYSSLDSKARTTINSIDTRYSSGIAVENSFGLSTSVFVGLVTND